MLAIQNELLLDIKASGFEQRNLLGFVVTDRSRALKRVQVIFKEALLLKLGLIHSLFAGHRACDCIVSFRRDAVYVTRHQLQPRVFKGGAAAVRECHPPLEIALGVVSIDQ